MGKNTRLRLVFSPTLLSCSTASCVLYNRTEQSRGFFICLISDMQTPSNLGFTLFKLDELLMSLGKLFENVSTSEFLRDIYIGQ